MLDQAIALLNVLYDQSGVARLSFGNLVMIAAGAGMIVLAVARRYEPLLFAGIGFACIVANVPAANEGALFHYAYLGMDKLIIPSLIALGVGAMTDFGPLIANPRLILLGAGAQLGVVLALVLAKALGFTLNEAGAIGIIGGADGPLAIFVTAKLAPHLLGPVAVAAFSYVALMSLMQQRMIRLLAFKEERAGAALHEPAKLERVAFPLVIAVMFNLFFQPVAPLITMFMLGNLLREVEATESLAKTAAGGMTNVIIIILTVAIGSTMAADKFLTVQTAEIVLLGLLAFVCGAASSVATAKLMNLFLKTPVNPLTGFAEASPAPLAARYSQAVVEQENRNIILIHHAMGPNLAGVFGAAISGGIILAALGVN
jgi:oxaloacetate decarboxylase beta subunit